MLKYMPRSRKEACQMAPNAFKALEEQHLPVIARETHRQTWDSDPRFVEKVVYYEKFWLYPAGKSNYTIDEYGPEKNVVFLSDDKYYAEVARRLQPVWQEYHQRRTAKGLEMIKMELEHYNLGRLTFQYQGMDVTKLSKPTMTEAVERGVALCPHHTGSRDFFVKEDDGGWSCNYWGAMWIGCYGLEGIPDPLPNWQNSKEVDAFLMKLTYGVSNWRRDDGSLRAFRFPLPYQPPVENQGGTGRHTAGQKQIADWVAEIEYGKEGLFPQYSRLGINEWMIRYGLDRPNPEDRAN
jgi:hypothetical protein